MLLTILFSCSRGCCSTWLLLHMAAGTRGFCYTWLLLHMAAAAEGCVSQSFLIGGNCVLVIHILPSLVETVYWEDIFFPHWWKLRIGKTYLPRLVETVLGRHIFPHWWKLCIGRHILPSLVESVYWEDISGGNCVLGRHILPSLVETVYWEYIFFPH